MYKKWLRSRWIAVALTLSMLFSMLPQLGVSSVQAAGGDLEVRFGAGTRIGNETFAADNAFLNFYNNQTPGFAQTETDEDASYDWASGHILPKGDNKVSVEFTINIADNPALRALAQSKAAEVFVGWDKLDYDEECFITWCKTRVTSASITVDGQELSGSSHGGDTFYRSMTKQIKDNSVINISVWVEGEGAGAYGIFIKFQDKHRPVLENYTFRGNGAERTNGIINQEELYAKQNEYISLAYNFNEPVKPTALSSAFYEHFLKHPLFVNPDGTGLPAAGQQQYMQNTSFAPGDFSLGYFDAPLRQSIEYKYITTKYHHSGNLPLEPKITGSASGAPIDQTLEQKLKGAVLADAAGNVAVIDSNNFIKARDASNNYLKGKTVNPFDYNHGGYRVIVDAVAPKYSKTGNGIQPEILTGVVLNKDDTIEFTVQLTEEVVVKTGWVDDKGKTFLLFNNGMKAYYDSGFNTSKLTFKTSIKDSDKWWETPLLKVIAMSHDLKNPADSDTNVIQDYAGNMLIQPANYDGIHVDGDESNVNSKIDWAKLSIDNTKPWIDYRYEAGGATDATYRRNGKVTIDANDPPLIIPPLDPSPDRGAERPSKGIYRPSNMTGEASPAVGLVYYYWSRNPEDPFASVSEHNFAAVKRYALAGKQPEDELYPKSKFGGMQLKVVNNKTNMIAPPAEALTDEGSGVWYLHTWTADMTWDSARELMQHKKKDEYVTNHPDEYERWKNEATGSEADKEFYATNKALAAVGDYGNLDEWTFDNYKQNDSNWTYNTASMKLDNRAPVIKIDVNDAQDKKTGNVKVPVSIMDEHSGVQAGSSSGSSQFAYQWVKKGEELQEIEWKTAEFAGNGVTLAPQNDIMEDGIYALAIKAADQAGNERVVKSEEAIEVDSTNRVVGQLSDANPEFVQSHDIEFRLQGLAPATVTFAAYGKSVTEATYKSKGLVTNAVYGGMSVTSSTYGLLGSFVTNVGYAFSGSVTRPGDGAYAPLVLQQINPANGELLYRIPADRTKNGEQFVHIRVMESDGRQHYFTKMYKFDNLPPAVTFSKSGVEYPLAKQTVTISIEDTSKNVPLRQYQWVKAGMPEPDEQSAGWVDIPANGEVVLDSDKLLQPGESADYRLFVKAVDVANNSVVAKTTGTFKVSKAGPGTPAPDAEAALIYLYGDKEDGYTAIMKLNLDREDKTGYEYSLSADNGDSWVTWRPYTNFVSTKVTTSNAAALQIQVKYRAPGGAIGKPTALDTSHANVGIEPVYALATVSSKPVNAQTGADIDITAPLGIKIVPSDVNPSQPARSGNKFNVKVNGFYSFELTDMSNTARKDTLYVSIGNVDSTKPQGTVTNLSPAPTNGNVSVMLEDLSEPVTITNNNGKSVYTFEKNGTFAFELTDEAGNKGTAAITVSNIDKEGPDVKIVRSYAYGENYSQTFGTIKDENGSVLYSSGVTLEVQKATEQAKDFIVLDGKSVITMKENGVASFTVSDRFGNTSIVKEEVTNIISIPPVPESVNYTFVDENGNPLPEERIVTIDGKKYARGQVQVTVSGKTKSPNKVFSGMTSIMQNGVYTNQISAPDGTYSYSRVYSADGSTMLAISDLLGNIKKVPVTIAGLDNKAPEIALNTAAVSVVQNKPDFDFGKDLGGYTVSDNVSKPEQIRVEISGLDLTKLGRQHVTYTAFDQVGNTATAYQDVVVVGAEGMLIFADDVLISGASTESALFDHNTLNFHITKYNLMDVEGWSQVNEWGTYDVLYYSGLYREGQMKYIAEKLTYDELVNKQFAIEFDKVGWYTMIVRTQEREREYAMFFIGNVD